jgi:hypothetical protein
VDAFQKSLRQFHQTNRENGIITLLSFGVRVKSTDPTGFAPVLIDVKEGAKPHLPIIGNLGVAAG